MGDRRHDICRAAHRGGAFLTQLCLEPDQPGELDPPRRVDGLSMLDGHLTALIIGPCSIPPEAWFNDLPGARADIAAARGATLAAIYAIVARINAISLGLSTAPERDGAILEETEDGLAHPHPWCLGFLTAMRLRSDARQPLLTANPGHSLLMLLIPLYRADVTGTPLPDLAHAPTCTEDLRAVPTRTFPASSRRSGSTGCHNGYSRRAGNGDRRGRS